MTTENTLLDLLDEEPLDELLFDVLADFYADHGKEKLSEIWRAIGRLKIRPSRHGKDFKWYVTGREQRQGYQKWKHGVAIPRLVFDRCHRTGWSHIDVVGEPMTMRQALVSLAEAILQTGIIPSEVKDGYKYMNFGEGFPHE